MAKREPTIKLFRIHNLMYRRFQLSFCDLVNIVLEGNRIIFPRLGGRCRRAVRGEFVEEGV